MPLLRKSATKAVAADLLQNHNPVVRALAERLRKIILAIVPDATETANLGWHSLSYRHPQSGYFCGIFPRHDNVQLVFEFGVLLPDPEGLLEGEGSQVRYMKIKNPRDVRVRALKKLLQAAIALPEKKEVKLGLIKSGAKPVHNRDKNREK